MYKYGFPALFSCGMKSLFFAIYILLSTSHCSNIFNNILVNKQLACKSDPPETPPASSLKHSFIFNKSGQCLSQPCQLHGCNVNAPLLLSVLLPTPSMAGNAFSIPLCCLHGCQGWASASRSCAGQSPLAPRSSLHSLLSRDHIV